MKKIRNWKLTLIPVLGTLALDAGLPALRAQIEFHQTNLVSDIPGEAAVTDPQLVNPWGIAESPGSPFWIADNGTGLSTLYTTSGAKQGLVVTIPSATSGTSAPTGEVFNKSSSAFNGDPFIFASEDGAITGWRGALGTNAEILLNGKSQDSVFKGLAINSGVSNSYLYATDFHNDMVDVLASSGAPSLSGSFVDPTIPSGFAVFGIQNINGELYVTYAKQDAAKHDDVAGPGNGYIDVFDLSGNFVRRLVSNGPLDSPWGLTLAPSNWGSVGGDLLVGNFGDGTIDAFNPTSGAFLGALDNASTGNPLVVQGLWGLEFGNGGNGGNADTLYFTAGIPGNGHIEDHGLFGALNPVPEPATTALIAGAGLVGLCAFRWLRRGHKAPAAA
jgi:uncharacterized protein (TIGR03118 family)